MILSKGTKGPITKLSPQYVRISQEPIRNRYGIAQKLWRDRYRNLYEEKEKNNNEFHSHDKHW